MTLTENQVAKNRPVKNQPPKIGRKKTGCQKPAAKNRPLVTKTAGIINITDKPSV